MSLLSETGDRAISEDPERSCQVNSRGVTHGGRIL